MDKDTQGLSLENKRLLYLSKWKQLKSQKETESIKSEIEVSKISSAQKRIWLHEQIADNVGGLYCVPIALLIKKEMNVEILQTAINRVGNRQSILKSIYYKDRDEVYLKIIPDMQIIVESVDMKSVDREQVIKYINYQAKVPFNIEKGPNIRLYHIQTSFGYIIFINMHHIIMDGWSIGIFINELFQEYRQCERKCSGSERKILSYAEFIHKYSKDESVAEIEPRCNEFWENELRTVKPLNIRTDYERPVIQEFIGAKEKQDIPKRVMSDLEIVCKQYGCTLFHIMVSALYGLLQKYSQQDDFAIGIPLANRNQMDTENTIGLFVNTVPLVQRCGIDTRFEELVNLTNEKMQKILQYQLPFEELVIRYVEDRNLSYSPIFQVMFDMQTVFKTEALSEYEIEYLPVDTGLTLIDMLFNVITIDEITTLELTYCSKIFSSETAKVFLKDYIEILQKIPHHFSSDLAELTSDIAPRAAVVADKRGELVVRHGEGINSDMNGVLTSTEKKLLSIWRLELKNKNIGVNESFFKLGGNSINAIGILTKILEEFKIELTVRTLMENSTVRKLSAYLDAVSVKQADKIQRIGEEVKIPLTDTQSSVYFVCQMEKELPLYNIPVAIEIMGKLNTSILNETIFQIRKRHEALRTRFIMLDNQIYQEVYELEKYELPVTDLSAFSEKEKKEKKQKILYQESQYQFDLNLGELIRFLLIKIDSEHYVLSITIHHIIADGWSLQILERDMTEIYNALERGRKVNLAPVKVRYRDYAYWYENNAKELETQIQFWKSELRDVEAFSLPTDLARGKRAYSGATCYEKIGKELTAKLKTKAKNIGVTDFAVLLSAFQLLMSSQSGENQTLLGIPVTNRTKAGVQDTVGFFTNILALQLKLVLMDTIDVFIQKIQKKLNEIFANQNVLFETLSKQMELPDELIHICFNYLNIPLETMQFNNLEAKVIDVPRDSSKYDIDFFIREQDEEMLISIEYNTELYLEDSIVQLIHFYLELLNNVVDQEVKDIASIRKTCFKIIDKKKAVSVLKNDAFQSENIVEQFMYIADKYSERAAVKTCHNSITYGELSTCVKHAGMYLRRKTQSGRIAVVAKMGNEIIKCIFAVLASGNTYIPLDVNYPKERIEFILEDSGADLILTDKETKLILDEYHVTTSIVTIEEAETCQDTYVPIKSNSLTYILYTSGTTGRPKGVMQKTEHVCGHIKNYTKSTGITEQDTVLQLASYCFDAAVMDIYGALLNGACLFIYDMKKEGLSSLYSELDKGTISIYHSTPTVYRRVFGNISDKCSTEKIRVFVLGGEEVKKSDYELFEKISTGGARLINGLGPTECTLAFQKQMIKNEEIMYSTIPVGYPVEGITVTLLDEDGNPGVLCGQMKLTGRNIAIGYLNCDEKNEVFSCLENGDICYKTGDYARILPNGEYIYIGRKDFQVKVRGIRIELSEIENTLKKHRAIREAKVVRKGEEYLGAYIICEKSEIVPETEFKSFLMKTLPKYMIPDYIEVLDEFPLTPSGKIDIQSLIRKEYKNAEIDILMAETEVEKNLEQIWKTLLHIDKVGVNQNFFDIGGNSLLTLVMQNEIVEKLSINVPVIELYQCSTIREIASYIEKNNVRIDDFSESNEETERKEIERRNQMRNLSRGRRRMK